MCRPWPSYATFPLRELKTSSSPPLAASRAAAAPPPPPPPPPVANADADGGGEGGGGGGAAEKRLAMMQRFAQASALDGPSKIGAPKVFKKEKAEASLEGMGYDDDSDDDGPSAAPPAAVAPAAPAEAAAAGLPGVSAAMAMGAADIARQTALQRAIEKEIVEQQRNAVDNPPKEASSFSKAPPAHLWPLPLKKWVEKCFLLCRTSLERTVMQKQVHNVIERAAEEDIVNTKEWDKEPVPSRANEKDKKREKMFTKEENVGEGHRDRESHRDRREDYRDRDYRDYDRYRDREYRDRRDDYDRRDD